MALAIAGVAGNLLDIRSHAACFGLGEDGSLTVPHVILYAAFCRRRTHRRDDNRQQTGKPWREASPEGYLHGLVGVVLFGLGGTGDALGGRQV